MRKIFLVLSSICLMSGVVVAQEAPKRKPVQQRKPARTAAGQRTGIGFNSQLSVLNLTSLAVRYWTSDDMAVEGIFGFTFGDNRIINIGGKVLGTIKSEQNMKVYGFGIMGVENAEIKVAGGTTSDTAVVAGGGLGTEFFLSGLPNLGFSTEFGINYNSYTKQFGTFGQWVSTVGIRYYLQ